MYNTQLLKTDQQKAEQPLSCYFISDYKVIIITATVLQKSIIALC
jgi:hypothetical protein